MIVLAAPVVAIAMGLAGDDKRRPITGYFSTVANRRLYTQSRYSGSRISRPPVQICLLYKYGYLAMSRNVLFSLYFFATFLQSGTYGLTFLMPPLFEGFGANEKDVGAVLACATISTIAVVIYSGHITTLIGRMNTIAASGFLISISLYMMSITQNMGVVIYSAGLLLGVGWGLFYTLTPMVLTELIPREGRVKYFTLLSVFIMAGFGLSPVLGSYMEKARYGLDNTFALTSGLCIVSGLIFFLLTKPVANHTIDQGNTYKTELDWNMVRGVLASRALIPIIMVGLGASVFAGMTNFQTVYARDNGLDYSSYFLAYTITVITCRVIFAKFVGGRSPYGTIAFLLAVMTTSVVLFMLLGNSNILYVLGAILFGIGYGVSYPIVKAMAVNDSDTDKLSQTLQLFGLSYFIGIFGFPFIAGWIITNNGINFLLFGVTIMAAMECFLAAYRYFSDFRN